MRIWQLTQTCSLCRDVIDGVTEKLTRRHPHVFGSRKVSGSDEVIKTGKPLNWKKKTERTHVLDGISPGLPALMRCLQAAQQGFQK